MTNTISKILTGAALVALLACAGCGRGGFHFGRRWEAPCLPSRVEVVRLAEPRHPKFRRFTGLALRVVKFGRFL